MSILRFGRYKQCFCLIVIVFVLANIFLPAVRKLSLPRGHSPIVTNTNHLLQLGFALLNFESKYGFFPTQNSLKKHPEFPASWRVCLLCFLDNEPLYRQLITDKDSSIPTPPDFLLTGICRATTSPSFIMVIPSDWNSPLYDEPPAIISVKQAQMKWTDEDDDSLYKLIVNAAPDVPLYEIRDTKFVLCDKNDSAVFLYTQRKVRHFPPTAQAKVLQEILSVSLSRKNVPKSETDIETFFVER